MRSRHYLIIGNCLIFVLALTAISASTAQQIGPPRLLVVDLLCPSYAVSGRSPISLHADVGGTNDPEILKSIVFKWSVSQASIISGQGTRNIVLRPAVKSGVSEIKINAQAEGGPPQLHYEKSCILKVNSDCSLAPMLDQYSSVSLEEERKHLDRLAQHLKAGPSESIAYLMTYAGERACIYESEWHAKRARQYLIENHDISDSRIVTVEAGFRKNWTVEMYVQPRVDCGPLPNPTLRPSEVHIQGRCGETELARPHYDDGDGLSFEEDKPRIDRFAEEMKKNNSAEAYIIAYGGLVSYKNEARIRLRCIRDYLITAHSVSPSRLKLIDGGYRVENSVELFVIKPDETKPTAFPIVNREAVRMTKAPKHPCGKRTRALPARM